ncbi:hypothetical protein MMK76_001016 [Klebsiella aerogenes]|jgi:hypothetical protein|uniref:hypothetical protein n=1 Tax=Klebsiella aerogenes TaxID=548 RepID=UPI0012F6EB9B|nr:hypothetical protein [Klebsiella aerogenes]EIY2645716.1 hypothetical protein [Klebsiella aerogenes]EKU2762950.1 hypothetical protein [Klebsiella aerogenes]ELA0143583.1 hypothetical protein [Klebsiella aerogenes]ELA2678776.1 hypothetical protein [Klebsiella aerogenes]ELS6157911.1 hypothetical protein [Klebsiella aerogenes]
MSDKTEYFSKFFEIEKRESFSPNQEISPDNFKELVGYYELDENVSCQVKTKRGFCRKNHMIGWLGVTVDGVEALIGGHCAQTYFKADSRFTLETKRIKTELDRREYVTELKVYKDNSDTVSRELSDLRTNLISVRKIIDVIYKTMPDCVLRFLQSAQRTNNWVINVDVLYPAKNEDQKPTWHVHTLQSLKSVSTTLEVISLITRVKHLIKTFDLFLESDLSEMPTPKLKYYVNELREKKNYEQLYAKFITETKKFIEPKNLDLLLFICDDYEDKFLTVRSIFGITGSKVSSDAYINLRIKRIEDRVSKQFNNYPVRSNTNAIKYKNNSLG